MKPENRQHVGPRDVVLAAHPGSGTSWIGTLLVHLGVCYVSGEDELLVDRESQSTRRVTEKENRPLPGAADGPRHHLGIHAQLDHLPALRDRDKERTPWREPLRVIKTNGSATVWTPPCRVLFLVRDGRDAVLSLYHANVNFSGLEVPLLDFLTGNGGAWVPPAVSWGFACMSWMATPRESLHILKFETCKERPLEEFRSMLAFLGVSRTDDEIRAAIDASSYDAMRRQESSEMQEHGERIGSGHVMRRGTVGQWREVYTDEMLGTFAGMPRRTLAMLGYSVDAIPHPPASGGASPSGRISRGSDGRQ
jgi:hypothetical protein